MLSPTATASVDVVQKWAFIAAGTGFDTVRMLVAPSGCRPRGAGVVFESAGSSVVGPCSLFSLAACLGCLGPASTLDSRVVCSSVTSRGTRLLYCPWSGVRSYFV